MGREKEPPEKKYGATYVGVLEEGALFSLPLTYPQFSVGITKSINV